MDESKKRISLKELLTMDLRDLKKLKSKGTGSASVSSSKSKREKKKRNPRKVIAFDIGSNTIKIVVGRHENEKLVIENMLDVPTPVDAIMDGKIFNEKELAEIIQYTLKTEKINVKDIIYTTDSTSIINRELLIPKVEEDEMETVIRYEIQQFLPINLNDYILQYTLLGEVEDHIDGMSKYKVNVISYPEKSARAYYDLLKDMDVKTYALDIVHNSVKKLLNLNDKINEIEKSIDETIAMIDMGAEIINVNIYKNNELDFTRIMRNGGNDIDNALSQRLEISKKLVESMKIEKADLTSILENDEINDVIKEVISEWLSDLSRIIQFYKNKQRGNDIHKIYIYGGTSNIKGLEKAIEAKLNIKTEKITSLSKVELAKSNLKEEPLEQYINAIGSIIRL